MAVQIGSAYDERGLYIFRASTGQTYAVYVYTNLYITRDVLGTPVTETTVAPYTIFGDTIGWPIHRFTGAAIDSNDKIHVVAQADTGDSPARVVAYRVYNTATQSWEGTGWETILADFTSGADPGYNQMLCGIDIDSSGYPHVVFTDSVKDKGVPFTQVKYTNRTSGSWSAPETVPTLTNANTGGAKIAVVDNNDIEVLWYDVTNSMLKYRRKNGTWGTVGNLELPGTPATGYLWNITATASSVYRNFADASGNLQEGATDTGFDTASGVETASGFLLGGVRYLFYTDAGNDLHYIYNDGGGWTDGADIEAGTVIVTVSATWQYHVNNWSDDIGILYEVITQLYATALTLGGTVEDSISADARVLRTEQDSISADARVLRTESDSVAAAAVVQATLEDSISADARVLRTEQDSVAADARVLRTEQDSVTTDAVIRATQQGAASADAVIQVTQQGAASADAVIQVTQQGAASADAVIQATQQDSVSIDARLLRIEQDSISADAKVVGPIIDWVLADAVIKATVQTGITADAKISGAIVDWLTVDAVIKAVVQDSISADARLLRIEEDSLSSDAVIKVTCEGWLLSDAVIKASIEDSIAADARVLRTEQDSVTADGLILRVEQAAVSAAAVIKAAAQDSISADARVLRTEQSSIAAAAVVKATTQDSITADAAIQGIEAAWVSPADGVPMSSTPVLVFRMPLAADAPMHFQMELDKADTFDTADLRVMRSYVSQVGWEYWDGDSWEAVPASGVPITYVGNNARYTVQSALEGGTWYRRVRGSA